MPRNLLSSSSKHLAPASYLPTALVSVVRGDCGGPSRQGTPLQCRLLPIRRLGPSTRAVERKEARRRLPVRRGERCQQGRPPFPLGVSADVPGVRNQRWPRPRDRDAPRPATHLRHRAPTPRGKPPGHTGSPGPQEHLHHPDLQHRCKRVRVG